MTSPTELSSFLLDVLPEQDLTVVTRDGAARGLVAGDNVVVAVDAADVLVLSR